MEREWDNVKTNTDDSDAREWIHGMAEDGMTDDIQRRETRKRSATFELAKSRRSGIAVCALQMGDMQMGRRTLLLREVTSRA